MVDISYITSCYNGEEFLEGLIENLLDQQHEDFEHIIVDSCSTDSSLAIAEKWAARENRVRVIRQRERTPYGVSWLEGWSSAKGRVVSNSNCDDRSYHWRGMQVIQQYSAREKLKTSGIERSPNGEALTRHASYNFYYGGYETRVNGVPTTKGLPPPFSVDDMSQFFRCGVHIHWDNEIRRLCHWDTMMEAAGQYKSAFDYWLVLYFMSLGVEGVPIPSCFSIYNQRSDSLEQSDKERNTFESIRAISEFYPDGKVVQGLENETRFNSPGFYQRYKDFVKQFA